MSVCTEIAESIVEHAEALARLDPAMPARAWNTQFAAHVHAIRVLAAPHVAPRLDLAFYRDLRQAAGRVEGVFVHLRGSTAEFLVDTGRGQQKFELWSPQQLREAGVDRV